MGRIHPAPRGRVLDGSPVTVEDVIWSYETLGTQGHGRYRGFGTKSKPWRPQARARCALPFNEADQELALLAGLRPILKKAQWDGIDFAESGLGHDPDRLRRIQDRRL